MAVTDRVIAKTVPLVPRPIVARVASRYVAGARLEETVPVIQDLNRQSCVATVDVLGEFTESKDQTIQTLNEYKQVLDAIVRHDLKSGVSVKLTALGLSIDEELCRANLEQIVEYAAERDRFVRVDMEDSPYTEATIQTVLDFHERHENIGAVIQVQGYLRRAAPDSL